MSEIINLLNNFRSRDPDLIADIEAAIRTMPEPNGIDANLAVETSPNLKAILFHSDMTVEEFVQGNTRWKARHFRRLVDELARKPEGSSYRTLSRIYNAVAHWVHADLMLDEVDKEPEGIQVFGL